MRLQKDMIQKVKVYIEHDYKGYTEEYENLKKEAFRSIIEYAKENNIKTYDIGINSKINEIILDANRSDTNIKF